MASRVRSRRHLLRDLPQTVLLLGCAAVVVTIGALIFKQQFPSEPHRGSSQLYRESVTGSPDSELTSQLNEFNVDKRYAGSIITYVPYRLRCQKRIFDNRTGYLFDRGDVKCEDAVGPQEPDTSRVHNIGKAFRHQ
jgi:hypothetical protein